MERRIRVVTAAIIHKDGRYLITQRPVGHLAGKWEFPGGEVGFGETVEDCLRREIGEELGQRVKVQVVRVLGVSSHIYDEARHIVLIGFVCKLVSGQVKKKVKHQWLKPSEMPDYDFCEADKPFVEKLQLR